MKRKKEGWQVEVALELPEGGLRTHIDDPHHEDPMDLSSVSFSLCEANKRHKVIFVKMTLLGGPVTRKRGRWYNAYIFISSIFEGANTFFSQDELGTVSVTCMFAFVDEGISWDLTVRQSIKYLESMLRIPLSHLPRKVSGNNELLVNRLSY